MNAYCLIMDAAAANGWTSATTLELLIDYIERQGDNAALSDYLAEVSR